jgi:ribosome maturation factor RimP
VETKWFKLIKEELQKSLNDLEIIVDEVTYYEQGKNKFLTVVLDKIGGIDLDTIVEATHIINPIIDKLDLPIEDYILDCISKER